jgi:hypothetical protein
VVAPGAQCLAISICHHVFRRFYRGQPLILASHKKAWGQIWPFLCSLGADCSGGGIQSNPHIEDPRSPDSSRLLKNSSGSTKGRLRRRQVEQLGTAERPQFHKRSKSNQAFRQVMMKRRKNRSMYRPSSRGTAFIGQPIWPGFVFKRTDVSQSLTNLDVALRSSGNNVIHINRDLYGRQMFSLIADTPFEHSSPHLCPIRLIDANTNVKNGLLISCARPR